jgi:hypothetical protein
LIPLLSFAFPEVKQNPFPLSCLLHGYWTVFPPHPPPLTPVVSKTPLPSALIYIIVFAFHNNNYSHKILSDHFSPFFIILSLLNKLRATGQIDKGSSSF